jgi:RNA polymerase sigma factor (TIGR02999 family)
MTDVTNILHRIEQGDCAAARELFPLVYAELRTLAAAKLRAENPGNTLQATALVHDAYLRLIGVDASQRFDSRGHFFSAAAEAMRRILIDHARKKATLKRGADFRRVNLDSAQLVSNVSPEALLRIDEALDKLAKKKPEVFQLVKLRYFAGLSIEEAAGALGTSPRSAYRNWTYARAWLHKELIGDD